jgi:hypothetical protein
MLDHENARHEEQTHFFHRMRELQIGLTHYFRAQSSEAALKPTRVGRTTSMEQMDPDQRSASGNCDDPETGFESPAGLLALGGVAWDGSRGVKLPKRSAIVCDSVMPRQMVVAA